MAQICLLRVDQNLVKLVKEIRIIRGLEIRKNGRAITSIEESLENASFVIKLGTLKRIVLSGLKNKNKGILRIT